MADEQMNGDIVESPLAIEQKIKWQELRWKKRRRMAWGSFCNLSDIILLLLFAPMSDSRLTIISDEIAIISFVFGGIIGAYMGFTTFEKYKMGK